MLRTYDKKNQQHGGRWRRRACSASGTISGPKEGSYGSMLEISWKGTKPVDMPDGSQRRFINDGDQVIMRGFSKKNGVRVGFGEVKSEILPSK